MSPEQALDTRSADARSDVYSLGCTFYYLLTGKPMYGGDTVMKRLVGHRDEPSPSLATSRGDVPLEIAGVFERLVAKRPQDRVQTMEEAHKALALCSDSVLGKLVIPHGLTGCSATPSKFTHALIPCDSDLTPQQAKRALRHVDGWLSITD